MMRRPPRSTRTDTLFPYTTLFRSLGVIEPAAHMFAFYFAILSAITPPVALAVYAAASLAKADLWEAGWAAVRAGAAGFIVPFMFVYEPALLAIGEWPRSEERRVGKECVSTCRARWWANHIKTKTQQIL